MGQAAFEEAIRSGDIVEGQDLSAIDWRELPAERIVVRNCSLSGADLMEAGLDEVQFQDTTFLDCRFRGAELINAKFSQCSFFDADRRTGCDFADVQLRGASFVNCNVSMSRFAGANLHAVFWQGCKASGADFEDASFTRKSGRTSVVAGKFVDCALDYANFARTCLDDCDFTGSSLRQADFKRARLNGTCFQRADLTEAIVDDAQFDKADLRAATLTGFDVTTIKSFAGIKVNQSQLGGLVGPLGIRVFPD